MEKDFKTAIGVIKVFFCCTYPMKNSNMNYFTNKYNVYNDILICVHEIINIT